MRALEQILISFFKHAAARDKSLISAIDHEQRFDLTSCRWRFTLPDLYTFLQHREDAVRNASYAQFRRAIYSSTINATIKDLGAGIVIDTNRGHTDKSVYAMVWHRSDFHE